MLEKSDLNLVVACSRDAIVMAGGKTGDTQADFLRIDQVYVSGCVRDGLHIEPSAAAHWIEDFHISNVRIYNCGRHGICIVQPNLSTTFINQGLFVNVEVRGSGQITSNGLEVYCEGQGTVSGQKVSEISWINCEFDAAGASNHGLSSFYLTETGSESDFDGWQWIGCTFEDVGDTIVGKTYAIFIAGSTVPSAKIGRTVPPSAAISPATRSSRALSKSIIATLAPLAA
mgnify:CR=1 FL=1